MDWTARTPDLGKFRRIAEYFNQFFFCGVLTGRFVMEWENDKVDGYKDYGRTKENSSCFERRQVHTFTLYIKSCHPNVSDIPHICSQRLYGT